MVQRSALLEKRRGAVTLQAQFLLAKKCWIFRSEPAVPAFLPFCYAAKAKLLLKPCCCWPYKFQSKYRQESIIDDLHSTEQYMLALWFRQYLNFEFIHQDCNPTNSYIDSHRSYASAGPSSWQMLSCTFRNLPNVNTFILLESLCVPSYPLSSDISI